MRIILSFFFLLSILCNLSSQDILQKIDLKNGYEYIIMKIYADSSVLFENGVWTDKCVSKCEMGYVRNETNRLEPIHEEDTYILFNKRLNVDSFLHESPTLSVRTVACDAILYYIRKKIIIP